ncbi:MAG: hypothetical protein VX519_11830 [Myxococcota bacterium]|nr:hypothetical protein [Myxococcota bacterium]
METEALLGQEQTLAPLLEAASAGRLHHCYLFEGPGGVGKHTAAVRIAMAAACRGTVGVMPCGECPECRHMSRGTHPDLVEIGLESEKKTPIISVRQAREVVAQVRMQRYSARRRTIIIDPVDRLGVEGANALLKTLEEPPDGTGFVLVTSRVSALLPTVLSRSQRVRFSAVGVEELRQWLEGRGIPNAQRVARVSEGRPGRALELAGGELEELDQTRKDLIGVLGQGPGELFEYANKLTTGKSRLEWLVGVERLFVVVESLVRDAALVGSGSSGGLVHSDQREMVTRWSVALWPSGVERLQQALDEARLRLTRNVAGRLVVESLLSDLATELGRARRAG